MYVGIHSSTTHVRILFFDKVSSAFIKPRLSRRQPRQTNYIFTNFLETSQTDVNTYDTFILKENAVIISRN